MSGWLGFATQALGVAADTTTSLVLSGQKNRTAREIELANIEYQKSLDVEKAKTMHYLMLAVVAVFSLFIIKVLFK